MAGSSTVPLSLVYVILLFVPGLLGLDLYLKSSRLVGRFSRLQYLAYSVFLSLLSLCLLYFLTPFYLGHFVASVPISPGEANLATIPQLTRLTLPNIVLLYILHVLSASALGLTTGFFNREVLNPDEDRDRREAWTYTFDEATLPPETIQVQLSSDRIVEGTWERKTWSEQERELYLQEPEEVEFTDEGKETDPIGRGIYIHSDDISQVILMDSDPQTNPEEAQTGTGELDEESGNDDPNSDSERGEITEAERTEAVDDVLEATEELETSVETESET